MSIKIEVSSAEVLTKSGIAAKTGKPYTIREQEAYAHTVSQDGTPQKYPSRIKVMLKDNQQPYAPGFYTIAPESFFVDRFDSLDIGLILRPINAAAVKAA
ncbi:MAG: single-stranded DNA-binding protein [Rugosibacter sp.]|nr:single-stranded DNA-binding protein [Rugosibacter sp.]